MSRDAWQGVDARLAAAPVDWSFQTVDITRTPPPVQLLHVAGTSHIAMRTADGHVSYGEKRRYHPDTLRTLDAILDARDAANEDADGFLPWERAA